MHLPVRVRARTWLHRHCGSCLDYKNGKSSFLNEEMHCHGIMTGTVLVFMN